jgi:hypothetical protein
VGGATLAVGDTAFIGVIIPTLTGKLLLSGSLVYALATATSASWLWSLYTGAFTVNGVAPTTGYFQHPTVAGGSTTTLGVAAGVVAAQGTVVFSPVLINAITLAGAVLNEPVGFSLSLSAAGGGGNVTAAGGGNMLIQELAP